MNTVFMHCRPGFEGEVCAELSEHAARLGVAGYAKGKASSACVVMKPEHSLQPATELGDRKSVV